MYYFDHKYPDDPVSSGFLIMEYVATDTQQSECLTDAQIDQVANIIRYMATFRGEIPGGLMGDEMRGLLWDDSDPKPESGNMQKLNEWIHIRRTRYSDTTSKPFVDFGQLDLVLCHLDVAPRNILWLTDGGAPWLLD